jgi:hypothetical protein
MGIVPEGGTGRISPASVAVFIGPGSATIFMPVMPVFYDLP